MLPFYLQADYQKKIASASAELKSKIPSYVRIEIEANELELKKQRVEEAARRAAFEKRAAEIGFAKALAESAERVDTAIAEAEAALKSAVIYKK